MTETPNDINELMSRDPCDLSAQDIDEIIAYHRRARAKRASGEKTTTPHAKVDLSSLLKISAPPAPASAPIKRRF